MNSALPRFAVVLVFLLAGCLGGTPNVDLSTDTGDGLGTAAGPAYEVVSDLKAAIHKAIEAKEPVTLAAHRILDTLTLYDGLASATDFKVTLRPSKVITPDTWAEVDTTRVPLPTVEAYEGEVVGKPEQLVRLTLTDQWARGTIRVNDLTYLVRIGLNGNLPFVDTEPTQQAADGSGSSSHPWLNQPAPPALYDPPEWNDDEEDCLRLVPPYVTPMTEGRSVKPAITARIILDGDAHYAKLIGPGAFPLMVAMLNEMDAIYDHEVGIRFQIVGVHLNTDEKYFPKPAQKAPLAKLSKYWNGQDRMEIPRDSVHLFTGHPSLYAQANCIGGEGKPEIAYTFTPIGWERNYTVFHTNAFAHELGHIFSAHHHYGNHAETVALPQAPPVGEVPSAGPVVYAPGGATIMIQGYTPGSRPVFGTLEKSVIRGWAEEHVKGAA